MGGWGSEVDTEEVGLERDGVLDVAPGVEVTGKPFECFGDSGRVIRTAM